MKSGDGVWISRRRTEASRPDESGPDEAAGAAEPRKCGAGCRT